MAINILLLVVLLVQCSVQSSTKELDGTRCVDLLSDGVRQYFGEEAEHRIIFRNKTGGLVKGLCTDVPKSEHADVAKCVEMEGSDASLTCIRIISLPCKSDWAKVFECWGSFEYEATAMKGIENCFKGLKSIPPWNSQEDKWNAWNSGRCRGIDHGVPLDCLTTADLVGKELGYFFRDNDNVSHERVRRKIKNIFRTRWTEKRRKYLDKHCADQFDELALFIAGSWKRRIRPPAKAPAGPQLQPGFHPNGDQQPYMQSPARPPFGNYWPVAPGPVMLQWWPMYG